jgi:sRNA-binding protein
MTEEELRSRWPAAFSARRLPLARGIHTAMGLPYPSEVLAQWTSNPQYLRNLLAENATRVDLDGNVTGAVTFSEKERAWFILHDLRNAIYRWQSERLRNPICARLPLSPAEAVMEIKRTLPKMPKREE